METGKGLIAKERQRQIDVEGWDLGHDDEHTEGELGLAADCYEDTIGLDAEDIQTPPMLWPWERDAWKPTSWDNWDRQRVKAAALRMAEIERLQRKNDKLIDLIDQ